MEFSTKVIEKMAEIMGGGRHGKSTAQPSGYSRSRDSGKCPLDQRMQLAAGEITVGQTELLALAGVETAFAESSGWLSVSCCCGSATARCAKRPSILADD